MIDDDEVWILECLVVESGHEICFSEHLKLFSIHLNLASTKLWQQNLVTNSDHHGYSSSCFRSSSWTNSNNNSFILLGLSFLRYQKTSLCLCFSSCSLLIKKHKIFQMNKKISTWMRTLSKRGTILLATADTTDMMIKIEGVDLKQSS